MIDTHAHLYLEEFDLDRNKIMQHAKDVGVEKIFLPNIDLDSVQQMLALCEREKKYCFPMMGLHPCSVKENYEEVLQLLETFILKKDVAYYGIGECGLDYYWDKTFVDVQKNAFEMQIQWAKKYQLPIIIHSRDALDDCIEMIAKYKDENLRGIFHCFSGTEKQLEKIIELDFFAGIGGVITFKNAGLDKVLKQKHLSHLVLETDAPYLAPVPFRGKRNESAYLENIAKKLSEVLVLEIEEIVALTNLNAQKIFHV